MFAGSLGTDPFALPSSTRSFVPSHSWTSWFPAVMLRRLSSVPWTAKKGVRCLYFPMAMNASAPLPSLHDRYGQPATNPTAAYRSGYVAAITALIAAPADAPAM